MEWIQLSLRVSWLLGVWLSARESLERDGYLFLRRKVSSTLYIYHSERTVFPECQLYEGARVCVCASIYPICIAGTAVCVTVHTFKNSSTLDLYTSGSRPV